jgi:hypothetical protein
MSLTIEMRSLLAANGRCALAATLPFLLVLAHPCPAAGFESKEKTARKACISGDYAKGVEILSDLYVETNDLTYVFNQGRCFEQNGRYQDAINRFHEYARKLKDAGKSVDPEVERHIADCQAMLDKQTGAPPPPVAPPAAPVARPAYPIPPTPMPGSPVGFPGSEIGAAQATPVPLAVGPQAQLVQAAPATGTTGAGLRIAGLTALGVGVAGLATGVILNVKANSLAGNLDRSDTSYSRSRESTRASYETWGWVGYGVGAACVAGGAILYFIGRSQGQRSQVTLVPIAGSGQAGAALQGAF